MSRATRLVMATCVLTFLMACFVLPLTAPPASACLVSYGYRPDIKIDLNKGGDTRSLFDGNGGCATSTSLLGAAIVAVATLGAIGLLGARALRQGETAAGGQQQGAQVLASYIHATSTSQPMPPAQGGPGAQ
ncbi:hypothetical protein ACQEU3_39225 [Spirillospora sp. CA-253888]